jgi:hypothetical protein
MTTTPAAPAASQQAAVDAALLVLKSMGPFGVTFTRQRRSSEQRVAEPDRLLRTRRGSAVPPSAVCLQAGSHVTSTRRKVE